MKYRAGDTLIEVTLAVGIFSMIAIGIVAVMSGGTSSAQTSLETTLTREEIDAQAEALRFIQASYIADMGSADTRYQNLWKEITSNSIDLSKINNPESESILQYSPSSCDEVYNPNNWWSEKPFIINTRALGLDDSQDIVVSRKNNNDIFQPASIYPRLVYEKNNETEEDNLVTDTSNNKLFRAEGIYIIGVKDPESTNSTNNFGSERSSAYYDFYIRTCWYGSNANEPSIVSTVIRLFDPAIIK